MWIFLSLVGLELEEPLYIQFSFWIAEFPGEILGSFINNLTFSFEGGCKLRKEKCLLPL